MNWQTMTRNQRNEALMAILFLVTVALVMLALLAWIHFERFAARWSSSIIVLDFLLNSSVIVYFSRRGHRR
jgi:hypothetical protein